LGGEQLRMRRISEDPDDDRLASNVRGIPAAAGPELFGNHRRMALAQLDQPILKRTRDASRLELRENPVPGFAGEIGLQRNGMAFVLKDRRSVDGNRMRQAVFGRLDLDRSVTSLHESGLCRERAREKGAEEKKEKTGSRPAKTHSIEITHSDPIVTARSDQRGPDCTD